MSSIRLSLRIGHIISSSVIFYCFLVCNILAAPPDLKVNGIYLQTISNGCNVRLVGVDICGDEWSADSYGPPNGSGGDMVQSVNSAITTWKSNCLRIPLDQDFWFGYSDGNSKSSSTQNASYQTKYQTFIDNVVAAASAQNAYVELDLHWSGSGNWGSSVNVKQQNMPDDHSADFWKDVAARYKNNPAVLFDLYNEPKGDSWSIWKNGGQRVRVPHARVSIACHHGSLHRGGQYHSCRRIGVGLRYDGHRGQCTQRPGWSWHSL